MTRSTDKIKGGRFVGISFCLRGVRFSGKDWKINGVPTYKQPRVGWSGDALVNVLIVSLCCDAEICRLKMCLRVIAASKHLVMSLILVSE